MSIKHFILAIALATAIYSCKDNSVSEQLKPVLRPLSLTASPPGGTAPVNITFTGTYNAWTDTTRMRVPEMFLIGSAQASQLPYSLPDTTVSAKPTYIKVVNFPFVGSYSVFMLLQTAQGDIYSDTLLIKIQ